MNHVDRDQGLAYWFRMNNNEEEELSIQCRLPIMRDELSRLMADPDIEAAHKHSVARHRMKIDELRATENYETFYTELTSPRLEKLSRLRGHFGANVFLAGPNSIPTEVISRNPESDWFFTVEMDGETQH